MVARRLGRKTNEHDGNRPPTAHLPPIELGLIFTDRSDLRSTMRRVLNLARIVFLLLSLLGIGSYYTWNERPDLVAKAHHWMKGRSLEEPTALAAELKTAKEAQDFDGVLRIASELEKTTTGVMFGDRATDQRRVALESLVAEHRRRGDLPSALAWADELRAFEPRNFPGEVVRAELLAELGRHEESNALLEQLMKVSEESPATRQVLAHALVREGDPDKVIAFFADEANAAILKPDLRQSMFWSRGVQDKWEIGYEIEFLQRADGQYEHRHEYSNGPRDVRRVRADLPVGSLVTLRDFQATIERPGGAEPVVLDIEGLLHANHFVRSDGALISTGGNDPYFILQSKEMIKATAVTISMTVIPRLSDTLTEFLASDAAVEAFERNANDLEPWVRHQLQRVINEARR